jgi:photosystem II stability/assembly factor-like uncharacterized protein
LKIQQPNFFTLNIFIMKTRFLLLLALIYMSTVFTLKAQWTSLNAHVPASNHKVWGLEVVGEDLIWGLTYNYVTFAKPEYLIKSLDGGATWTATPIDIPEDQYSLHIFPLDENTAWLATTDEANPISGKIFKTTDGGQTWTAQTTAFAGFNETPAGVYFWNENEGVAFGSTGLANYDDQISVYRTVDGGENWTKVVPPDFPAQLPHEGLWVYCDNGFFDVQGDNVWFVTNGPRIYRSTDRGLTWTAHDTGLTNANGITSIAFQDELSGISVARSPNAAARTSDGGITWEPLAIPSSPPAVDIINVPGTLGTYVLHNATADWAGSSTLTLVTYDNGDTWDTLSTGPNFDCMEFKSPTLGFAGGIISSTTSGIYRWDGGSLRKPVFVNDDAAGANNGTSWMNAFTDLQSALAIAQEGDQIWVAEGTYKPGEFDGNPASTFLINKNLLLYGGFAGTETSLAERGDPADHLTTLSGDLNGDDVLDDFVTNRGDNVMNVVRIQSNINNSTIINGFVVQGGHADGSANNHQQRGGGFYSLGVPIIQQCSFLQNYAFRAGGGIHQDQGPSPGIKMEDCHFESNRASNGAGLYMWSTSFEISDCVFQNNKTFDGEFQANGGGASIALSSGTIRDCLFKGNEAFEYSGGLGFWFPPGSNSLNVSVSGCDFENNAAGLSGGGLGFAAFGNAGNFMIDSCDFFQNTAMGGSGFSVDLRGPNTEFTLTNSHFSENQTTAYYATASVYTFDAGTGTATIDNCTFENNHSVNAGGLDIGSLEAGDNFDFYITNCIFRNNVADVLGGGFDIFGVKGSTPNFTIENCLIEGNSAGERAAGFWVDVVSSEFQATMRNCRISGNESPRGSGIDIFQFDVGVPPYTFPENATLRLENCLISENASDFGVIAIDSFPDVRFLNSTIANNAGDGLHLSYLSGVTLQNTILSNPGYLEYEPITNDVSVTSNGGNLVLDNSLDAVLSDKDKKGLAPDFEPGTYQPSATSPLVNGGINEGVTATTDLAGNPRIQHGIVDIGAYESMFTSAKEVIAGKAALSPNPVAGLLNIHLPETTAQAFNISIYDTQGRLVKSFLNAGLQRLEVGWLTPGAYSVKVTDGERVYVGRFVKQ